MCNLLEKVNDTELRDRVFEAENRIFAVSSLIDAFQAVFELKHF